MPPYNYVGDGAYGVDQWQRPRRALQHHNLSVVSTTECDPATNTYDLTFEVDWEGAP